MEISEFVKVTTLAVLSIRFVIISIVLVLVVTFFCNWLLLCFHCVVDVVAYLTILLLVALHRLDQALHEALLSLAQESTITCFRCARRGLHLVMGLLSDQLGDRCGLERWNVLHETGGRLESSRWIIA